MAEPGALRRALDQAGDIGQHELPVVELDGPRLGSTVVKG